MKMENDPGEYDFIGFLPEFREKGVVTIIDAVHGNRLLHSSVHDHWGGDDLHRRSFVDINH